MDRRKSWYGLTENFRTLTAPALVSSAVVVSGDSTMEFELPGEEKKNRWEAKTAAKSGGDSWSESEEEEEEKTSSVVDAEVVVK